MSMATQPTAFYSLGFAAERLNASPDEIVAAMRAIGATFAELRNGIGQLDAATFERLKEHFEEESSNGQG